MEIVQGDLIELAERGEFDVIVQGCNCFHTQASGLAGQLARKYPQVLNVDRLTEYGSREKLGSYSIAHLVGFAVINVYTQYEYGKEGDLFEYDAFQRFLDQWAQNISTFRNKVKYRIGFPMIGCGLAGGNSERILKMISEFSDKVKFAAIVTVVQK